MLQKLLTLHRKLKSTLFYYEEENSRFFSARVLSRRYGRIGKCMCKDQGKDRGRTCSSPQLVGWDEES